MIIQLAQGKPMKSHKLQTSEDAAGLTKNAHALVKLF